MKRHVNLLFLLGVILRSHALAQGTLYFSNLGQPSIGDEAISSDSWLAQLFRTGTNSGGYVLNSVQLLMAATSGNASGFSASIYSNLNPINHLGNLSGSDPSAGGVFTYTASDITLLPSTSYFVVLTAVTPVAQGYYSWSKENSGTGIGANGWFIAGDLKSSDGSSWTPEARGSFYQLAINATAIPEPSSFSILLASGLFLCVSRVCKKNPCENEAKQ